MNHPSKVQKVSTSLLIGAVFSLVVGTMLWIWVSFAWINAKQKRS
jgi:hypothetical protein